MNQNEITSGRSKRSQTRIAPGSRDPAGGSAARVCGAGQLRGFAVVLGDVGVAFQPARGERHGELGQRPVARLAVEAERAAASPASR